MAKGAVLVVPVRKNELNFPRTRFGDMAFQGSRLSRAIRPLP
jgi:hypothetical protein